MTWISRLLPARGGEKVTSAAAADALQRWRAAPEASFERSHYETRYVVLNTEASSLDVGSAQLLAVAAISVEDGLLDARQSYYAPLADGASEALANLLAFCGRQPVVMFNAGFHRSLLEANLSTNLGVSAMLRCIDLYFLLPALFADRFEKPVRLSDWMASFRIETFQRHHALGDAWAIAQLFLAAQARALRRGAASPKALIELEQAHREYRRRG